FQQKEISDDDIDTAIYEIRSQKLNYILIGMPGAGKTYLGGQMAKARNRDFYDLDTCIEKNEGMSRRKIIEEKGEDYFRNKETECLRRLCKKNGIIIAAGSGIVTRKANYSLMKQNGRIIWIKRDLDKLETDDYSPEPEELKKLYDERAGLYDAWSDYFIDNNQEL
ncbi:MAG: shikimate kinase, partial [Eubacterium sp.]